ncbi:MAG: molybdopterin-dependent oxidoreductase [Dehalococcoidia bacterium]
MGLSRRQFLKWAGVTGVGAVVFNGCRIPDHEIQVQSPVQLAEDLVSGRDNYYATAAQSGSGSEGLLVRVMEGRAKKVEGNPDYPLNTGAHSVRSEALLQALYHPDRLQGPMARIAPGGPFRQIGWPEAMEQLAEILQEADPASVLMATGAVRGRLADVINAFSQSYGGRVMGFEPLEQGVLRGVMSNLFGQTVLPTFDLANTNFLLGFGADFLGTWLAPVHFSRGYGEFRQGANRQRGRFVQVDTRYSMTAAAADRWMWVRPGTEGLMAMAMIHTIVSEGLGDPDVANALTGGQGAGALSAYSPSAVAAETGVDADDIVQLARTFANPANQPALAIGGGSAAAHTNGTFNLTAIYSLNLLVGSVNQPGGIIFNPATVHSQIQPAPVREWKAALEDMRAGNVSVLMVRDANLAYGLPGSLRAQEALEQVGTIISFSSFLDETTAMADLILPGHTPLEEWGSDTPEPGPGYETVAFQQPVVRNYRDSLAFGDTLIQVGRQLGLEGDLPWENMREAVRAAARTLHETGRGSVTMATFEEFWRRTLERGGWWDMNSRVNGQPSAPAQLPTSAPQANLAGNPEQYPFYLVPFESQALGSGEYAHLPWAQSVADPITTVAWTTWVEINPRTAERLGVEEHDVVQIESPNGRWFRAPVYVSPAVAPDVIAAPFGQGHQYYTSYAANRGANLLDIIEPNEDQETGALAWAGTRVRLVATRRRQVLPKREGIEPAYQLPHEYEHVILVHRDS